MADSLILVDTSILIDYYRKTDKHNSVWVALVRKGHNFSISAITKYEIYSGATQDQLDFWNKVLEAIDVIPFDEASVDTAVEINTMLKRKRKQIHLADLFIAATAITHRLPIATLNRKHFSRIDSLSVVSKRSISAGVTYASFTYKLICSIFFTLTSVVLCVEYKRQVICAFIIYVHAVRSPLLYKKSFL